MEAVGGELLGRDIGSDVAGLSGFGDQVSEESDELLLDSFDVLVLMDQRCEIDVVSVSGVFVQVHSDCVQDGLERLAGVVGVVGQFGKASEVSASVSLVPGDQDRFDVGVVLVEGGPAYPGLLGDLGHGHVPKPVLSYEGGGGIEDGVFDFAAMRLDRLLPQPGHAF